VQAISDHSCHFAPTRQTRPLAVVLMALVVCAFSAVASAQKPQAILPQLYLDTTYNPPVGGTTWAAHTSAQLSSALNTSAPGDIIVLDAGVTYAGNWILPAKTNPNNKWIYIISSQLAQLPEGQRVSPANAVNMPKIVTPNAGQVLRFNSGANHWRLAGLEITTASTQGCMPTHNPPVNCFSYSLVDTATSPAVLPDSITIDRSYVHGTPTIDLQRAIQANASNYAVVDSYISEVHMIGTDCQAIAEWASPGPFKIVNNYLEAATDNLMFGGAGGANNPYIASDIEIRNNYLFKPLSWVDLSVNQREMVVKNAFELKNAQRVLFDSNTIENNWANGQVGFAIVLTVMTSQSGNIAVVNDITVTNNILKNVVSGFNIVAKDYTCKPPTTPNCTTAGSQDRFYIANNLITFYDPQLVGGVRNAGMQLAVGTDYINGGIPGVPRDIVFQHNTMIPAASTPCWNSVVFANNTGQTINHITNNVWLLDNVLCREVGWVQGAAPLVNYMGDPTAPPYDITQRFRGNVMYAPPGDKIQTYPAHNYATMVPFTYVSPAVNNYQLASPYWTDTSDGKLTGIDYVALLRALASASASPPAPIAAPPASALVGASSAAAAGTLLSARPMIVPTAH